jgi:enediyne biosynthesis protein E4
MRSLWLIALVLLISCKPEQEPEKLFRLVPSSESGITFSNDLNNEKLNIIKYMYYYNGGGVAAGDINNDGLIDLYFTSNEGENKLYLNKGNFIFDDVTTSAGVAGVGDWSTGVTMVDINNDGLLDIYVCQVGDYKGVKGKNQLFINNGDLTFTESAAQYGLDFSGFSTQAVFFDYDNDGDLDMYLLNHSVHTIHSYGSAKLRNEIDPKAGDRLFKNVSETGEIKFVDVTKEAGIYSSHIGYGLGVAVSDVNMDGWPDIYIANDFHENDYLYINNGDGTFTESLEKMIAHTSRYSMGCDIADLNADGWPDIISLDMLPEDPEILLKSAAEDTQEVSDIKKDFGYSSQYVRNCLQINRHDHFAELAQYAGIHASDWSWSVLMADFNNDTNTEIFISNGIYKRPNDLDYIQYTADMANFRYTATNEDSIESEMIRRMPTLKISNYMFKKTSGLKYENSTAQWGLAEPSYSNGMVYADLDNDGDLDLIINNVNQPAFVYENRTEKFEQNSFIQIELRGKENYFGIGAKVKVYADGKMFFREMFLSRGFQSSVAPELHLGLGSISTIDSIEVFWKSNQAQVLKDVAINQTIKIEQADELLGRPLHQNPKATVILTKSEIQIPFQHEENLAFKDYNIEPLIPYLLSREGPALAIADVNADGRDDIFIGGAKGQAAALFLQNADGSFTSSSVSTFSSDASYEDVDAIFFDVNNDGHSDLYVVSGGNEYASGHPMLEDRLYLNDGKGNFNKARNTLPKLFINGSCVRSADFDGDGFVDLFIGSRSLPGNYGLGPDSYILRNNGNGSFELHQTIESGMVKDAAWADIDNDGKAELIVLADWKPVQVYKNSETEFKLLDSKQSGFDRSNTWWRSLLVADINGDGMPDIVAGSLGENNRLKPSMPHPVSLLLGDFDGNGKTDPIIFYYQNGVEIPFHAKMQLAKQMPVLNKRFTTYTQFASVTSPADLLTKEKVNSADRQSVYHFNTSLYINQGDGKFQSIDLPEEVQFSTVQDILVHDFNDDGYADILLLGNAFSHSVYLGNMAAQSLALLLGGENSTFRFINLTNSDNLLKEYKRAEIIRIADQSYIILIANNNQPEVFSIDFN